jgi:NADH-quinone oxidoreductase subunit G
MIDVCPVGALTDKTFRFKSSLVQQAVQCAQRMYYARMLWKNSMDVWRRNSACYRKKDVYHEVEEFICNSCRFDHKDPTDWVIEGPRKFR